MTRRSQPTRPPGQRQLRVGEQIRHILCDILREGKFRDPDLSAPELITITAVELGPDLAHGHVYVMPLGGKNIEKIVDALNRASGYIRSELGQHLDLRYTPKLSFKYDISFDESAKIDRLLEKTKKGE
jgi:ribosome-binding factor A